MAKKVEPLPEDYALRYKKEEAEAEREKKMLKELQSVTRLLEKLLETSKTQTSESNALKDESKKELESLRKERQALEDQKELDTLRKAKLLKEQQQVLQGFTNNIKSTTTFWKKSQDSIIDKNEALSLSMQNAGIKMTQEYRLVDKASGKTVGQLMKLETAMKNIEKAKEQGRELELDGPQSVYRKGSKKLSESETNEQLTELNDNLDTFIKSDEYKRAREENLKKVGRTRELDSDQEEEKRHNSLIDVLSALYKVSKEDKESRLYKARKAITSDFKSGKNMLNTGLNTLLPWVLKNIPTILKATAAVMTSPAGVVIGTGIVATVGSYKMFSHLAKMSEDRDNLFKAREAQMYKTNSMIGQHIIKKLDQVADRKLNAGAITETEASLTKQSRQYKENVSNRVLSMYDTSEMSKADIEAIKKGSSEELLREAYKDFKGDKVNTAELDDILKTLYTKEASSTAKLNRFKQAREIRGSALVNNLGVDTKSGMFATHKADVATQNTRISQYVSSLKDSDQFKGNKALADLANFMSSQKSAIGNKTLGQGDPELLKRVLLKVDDATKDNSLSNRQLREALLLILNDRNLPIPTVMEKGRENPSPNEPIQTRR